MAKRLTTEDFIEKCKIVHGDRYDYSLVEYVNDQTKVMIKCLYHGVFNQSPNSHYRSGCSKCSLIKRSSLRRKTLEIILSRFNEEHGDVYDYSMVNYTMIKSKVSIRCKKHDLIFYQSPCKHIESKSGGCPECNSIGKGIMSSDIFIRKSKELHGSVYDYSSVLYRNSKTKIKILCNKHGYFEMMPNSHLSGRGCPNCNRNGSILEREWLDIMCISDEFRQYKIDKYYVDGIDIDNKIIYEFYGDFWHGNPELYNNDDINKISELTFGELYQKTMEREDKLKSLGYKVISIWESDYKKIYKL
jgi:hypothetical protein